jgi:hypothetical protein
MRQEAVVSGWRALHFVGVWNLLAVQGDSPVNVIPTLIVVFALACGVASAVCMFRKRWWHALLFALPVLLITLAVTIEHMRGRAIRDARQKAMERGDIPWEKDFRK